jgi:hypothetical protein
VRVLVLGVDEEGRSHIVSERVVSADAIAAIPGTAAATLFKTEQSPPPPSAPGKGTVVPSDLAPGIVHWYVVEHGAPASVDDHHAGTELHRRDSIDLVVVLDGDAELLLGDGCHPVHERDCIVMAGVDHGLRPGPKGCRLMSFAIGTPPATGAGTTHDA